MKITIIQLHCYLKLQCKLNFSSSSLHFCPLLRYILVSLLVSLLSFVFSHFTKVTCTVSLLTWELQEQQNNSCSCSSRSRSSSNNNNNNDNITSNCDTFVSFCIENCSCLILCDCLCDRSSSKRKHPSWEPLFQWRWISLTQLSETTIAGKEGRVSEREKWKKRKWKRERE